MSTEFLLFLFSVAAWHVAAPPGLSNLSFPLSRLSTGEAVRRRITSSGSQHATSVKDLVLLNLHLKQKMITENPSSSLGRGLQNSSF